MNKLLQFMIESLVLRCISYFGVHTTRVLFQPADTLTTILLSVLLMLRDFICVLQAR